MIYRKEEFREQREINAKNIVPEKRNTPVAGLLSCGHSMIALLGLSTSVLISMELKPVYTRQTTYSIRPNPKYVSL